MIQIWDRMVMGFVDGSHIEDCCQLPGCSRTLDEQRRRYDDQDPKHGLANPIQSIDFIVWHKEGWYCREHLPAINKLKSYVLKQHFTGLNSPSCSEGDLEQTMLDSSMHFVLDAAPYRARLAVEIKLGMFKNT